MAKQKQSAVSAAQRREQQRQQRQSRLEGAQAKAAVTSSSTSRPKSLQQNRRKRLRRGWDQRYMLPIVVVLIVGIIGVFVLISHLQNQPAQAPTLTSSQVFNAVTHVDPTILESVGTGGVKSPFQIMKSSGSTPLTPLVGPTGKPEMLYIGAEYCPYCAAQRWAMVVALSRFGTFSQLYQITSSSSDIFPNTPTFSFYSGLYKTPLYTSQYIDFVAVETLGNTLNSSGTYPTLQQLTSEQQQLFATYDAPPYIDAAHAESIPFIDVGNKYVAIGLGSGFSSQDLQGMQWSDIANSLASSSTTVSQHILGTANYITSALCPSTNQQPASVCSASAIQQIEPTIEKGITRSNGSQGTPLTAIRPAEAALRDGITG